jgi:hypothetical protein
VGWSDGHVTSDCWLRSVLNELVFHTRRYCLILENPEGSSD